MSTDLPSAKAVSTVSISLSASALRPGDTAQAKTTLRDAGGVEIIGRTVSWSSSEQTVATVSSTGLVRAIAPGATTISATSEGKSGTLAVIIIRPLAVTGTDTLLEPGKTFQIRGHKLRDARVSIAGVRATTLDAVDTSLTIIVPATPWAPCVGPAARFPISITTQDDSLEVTVHAAEQQLLLDLAIGAYADLPANVLGRECRMQLRTKGTYLALPFVPERSDGSTISPSDSIAVMVRVDGAGGANASLATGRDATPEPRTLSVGVTQRAGPATSPHGDVVVRTSRSMSAAACPLPPLGNTVAVRATRDSLGRLVGLSADGAGATEPWKFVGQGRTIAVMIDTAMQRDMQTDPTWAQRIDALVAISDTSVAPFIQSVSRGFPDNDGNGTVIVYVSAHAPAMANYAFNSSLRVDCPLGGEAIFLNWTYLGTEDGAFFDVGPLVHELAHIADYAWNARSTYSEWAIEGFATLVGQLYNARNIPDPLMANFTSTPKMLSSGTYCVTSPTATMRQGLNSTSWKYVLGCGMIAYLAAQYRERFGGTTGEALAAWTRIPNALTMEDADSYLGMARGASRSFGHFLLSFYADDYVVGIAPELRQPMWDPRRVWANDFSFFGAYPLPDAALSASTPSTSFRLGAPDVRFVELDASADASLTVTRAGRDAADLSLLVFRAR